MRILHLYRPALPGLRAQAIQVLHTCHALALLGHEVTLIADRGGDGDALASLGLAPAPTLDLQIHPWRHRGVAGWRFRRALAKWWAGPPGVVYARDKRRLLDAIDTHPPRHLLVLEAHELDSAQAAERGADSGPPRRQERDCASAIAALVTNCGGTLAAWEGAGLPRLPHIRRVIHNATAPDRAVPSPHPPDPVIRLIGSLRAYKGVDLLPMIAAHSPLPIECIGGSETEIAALGPLPLNLRAHPAVPYPQVSGLLARSRALLLPLADNLFGRQLTSPLKLWDYLATQAPIVAPDLPSVREIAALSGVPLHLHTPGDAESAAAALDRALAAPARSPFVRTWHDRALEIDALLQDLRE